MACSRTAYVNSSYHDPEFATKLRDIVGLYVDPPAHAVVLSVDEKSQIQALDRTQPGLPMKKGRCGTMTHDYVRNGTTTLFAALNVLEGRVIGRCMQHHRHQEFIRFLNTVDAEVPAANQVHAIMDNYATHKHPKVIAWLERHPRWVFHFTPTSASWLNAVEGFFAKLAKRRLKRGVFHSLVSLQAVINRFVADTNADPQPFQWTKDPEKIIAAVRRGHQTLDSIHYGVAKRELLPDVEHRKSRYLNNRAENSHRPTRRRERQMQRFKSAPQAQRFLSAHAFIYGHFHPRRHRSTARNFRSRVPWPSRSGPRRREPKTQLNRAMVPASDPNTTIDR